MLSSFLYLLPTLSLVAAAPQAASGTSAAASLPTSSRTTCNGKTYVYNQLAGYGFVPSRSRDKFGDTLGGFGSAVAIDQSSWKKTATDSYSGTLWALPDRGWNTNGTLNYQNRVHKFAISFRLAPNATISRPSSANLNLTYQDTVLFTGPDFQPVTGLDGGIRGPYLQYPLFPQLPSTNFTGDGFGGSGNGGRRITVDSEGLVLGAGGTFWVSDEYGPYIYQFSPFGNMVQAIRPPDALIPHRNGSVSFSAASPPAYNPSLLPVPANTQTGRNNNQGLEGLTVSSDGKRLYALMQSALDQEGGPDNPNRRQARLLVYDISIPFSAKYIHEYVVTLPLVPSGKKVAAQSEIHYVSDTQFLILSRDSGNGRGQGDINSTKNSESTYRHADVFDITSATDIRGGNSSYDAVNGSIASSTGVLKAGINAAQYCSFLDYNNNTELGRFGLHNGGIQNATLLNEKWESLAPVPVNPGTNDGQYFLFSLSDNDFITQQGYQNFGRFQYKDASGFDLDNQALVFRVTLPTS